MFIGMQKVKHFCVPNYSSVPNKRAAHLFVFEMIFLPTRPY